jgi:hypothetical protein
MNRQFTRICTVSASALVLTPLFTRQVFADSFGMMSDYGGGMGWGHIMFSSVMMILFFVGLVLASALARRL